MTRTAVEYLALTPGAGRAGDASLFDALPFAELRALRVLDVAGENAYANALGPRELAMLAHLHTLRFVGAMNGAIPSPCTLARVWLSRMSSREVDALAACTQLRELSTDDAETDAAEPIARLTMLERLHLRHWPAANLTSLIALSHLRSLSLPASHAQDFSFIAKLTTLTEIDLSQTALEDASPLLVLPQLRHLDLSDVLLPAEQIEALRARLGHDFSE